MTMRNAMPGAFRMRALYPLIDGDGSCTLIYDLERAAVVDVPEELQFHVAPALDRGEPDEELLSWLMDEDLYTCERSAGGTEEEGLDLAGDSTWGGLAPREGELRAPLEHVADEQVPAALELAFKQGLGAARIALHLSWGGSFPGDELLSRIVVEASRRAAAARQEVRFEFALDAWVVSPAVAGFLAGCSPLHVRLQCGTFPAVGPGAALPGEDRVWSLAERGVRLLAGLAERLTVQCVLDGPARLHDLWIWAQQAGVRHLDATRLEEETEPLAEAAPQLGSGLRQYRGDLMAISDDLCGALEEGRTPIDFQPLTRAVRRLMQSELALPGAGDGLGGPVPSARARELQAQGDAWRGLDETYLAAGEAEGAGGPPCAQCWARFLCEHSELAAGRADRREPTPERCAGWLLEVEVALRLYHRLAQVDVLQVRRLFEEAGRMPAELGAWRGGWQQKVAF